MEKRTTRFLIVGAGPTGLGAAYRLHELGIDDFLVIDADEQVGGLAKSIRDPKGFTWDMGGHVQFSHYAYFDQVMERAIAPREWFTHQRESWVWIRDRFVPYPFQNNLRYLPKEELWRCVASLLDLHQRPATGKPANFQEWIHASFGSGVAEVFMEPYNFKVWATPPRLMSYSWIGERVAVPDIKRLVGNVMLEKDDVSWGPNNVFRFPYYGGTGAIWEKVADDVGRERILLKTRLESVAPREKKARCGNLEIQFQSLLNTTPLDLFVSQVAGFPEPLRQKARQLAHSTTHIVGIGLKGKIPPHLQGKCWMYFPESNCPFYRATVFSHYSPYNVPDPASQWSLMLEVSESGHKPVVAGAVVDDVIRGCQATRLIARDAEILSTAYYRLPYGYPIPSLDRDAILAALHAELEPLGIFSRGRFGGWKYEVSNQDHSMMQGVEWADRMLAGREEGTYTCRKGLGAKEPLPERIKAA
jgi:protoporphyrinogen oxidase